MSSRPTVVASPSPELIRQLRAQVDTQTDRAPQRVFAVPPGLTGLLPDAGLRSGSAYTLDTAGALLLALLAEPSRAGAWCGVVGLPEVGVEAAGQAGVVLDRLALVPQPGDRWLAVVAALAEVLGVIAVRPGGAVRPADAARLSARLWDREATLLVVGEWPRAEASLRVEAPHWSGVGAGHGYLTGREVTLTVTSRRTPRPHSARLLLPGPDGRLEPVAPPAPVAVPLEATEPFKAAGRLKAVG
ncbi:hypothetical protein [Raineyella sp. W15-4]|uniref:hypothetical protein n=1 Tax=Raineyella sp. W15-4 TaxID=3081651 RepID=UPI0029545A4C|nr:hypothetical protein [Raineyella sp. W15-4]WOQ15944.1 hypothetical protein R0145_12050 [Raineyella sp. W15-4]